MQKIPAIYFDGQSSAKVDIWLLVPHGGASSYLLMQSPDTGDTIAKWEGGQCQFSEDLHRYKLQHQDTDAQVVVPTKEGLVEVKGLFGTSGVSTFYNKVMGAGIGVHISIAVALLGLVLAFNFLVLPSWAEHAVVMVPEELDNTLGKNAVTEFLINYSLDSSKTALLNEYASHIDFGNTRELKFYVVDAPVVNAFAFPDGSIFVFKGIIDIMDDHQELAGLLAHEAVHVNQRHGMKSLCRSVSSYIFISLVFSDVNGIMSVLMENANQIYSLSYSRNMEKEADLEGVAILSGNGIGADGMEDLFKHLKEATDIGLDVPAFMSSHPLTKERIEYVHEANASANVSSINQNTQAEMQKVFRQMKPDVTEE